MYGWQYLEPESLDLNHRFELDKEAYIKTFFDPELDTIKAIDYKESTLIGLLLKKLNNAEHPYFTEYRMYLEKLLLGLNTRTPPQMEQIPTRSNILRQALEEYGFMKLNKVSRISDHGRNMLFDSLLSRSLPYKIAMLHYLGFLDHLLAEYVKSKYERNRLLHQILQAPERTVKGNIAVLNPRSKENRGKYTAHTYQEQVEKDYQTYK